MLGNDIIDGKYGIDTIHLVSSYICYLKDNLIKTPNQIYNIESIIMDRNCDKANWFSIIQITLISKDNVIIIIVLINFY